MKDDINSPDHYTGDIECIDAMRQVATDEEFIGYCRLAAFKYLWRCNYKGNKEKDLRKAHWYLTKVVAVLDETGVDCRVPGCTSCSKTLAKLDPTSLYEKPETD